MMSAGDTDKGSIGEGESTKLRESSELELCPSAADSLELKVGTEFFLLSLLLPDELEEQRDAAE